MQREQYLREKKEGSEAYRKALDTQVRWMKTSFIYRKIPCQKNQSGSDSCNFYCLLLH